MNIVLKDKIKIDKNFIDDLIAKSWHESESIQNQIASIENDSLQATKVVKLLKDLLTSYYVFTGCLESIENEPTNEVTNTIEPVVTPSLLKDTVAQEEPITIEIPDTDTLAEFDTELVTEPFEYFVDFEEPTGEPLTDDDLYK